MSKIDLVAGERALPLGLVVRAEDQRVARRHDDPAAVLDLAVELPGPPAGVAEDEQRIARPLTGVLFALLYACVVGASLPGGPVLRGLIFAAILLVVSQLVFVPFFLRDGFFGIKTPRSILTAITVHIVFGAILGWLAPVV